MFFTGDDPEELYGRVLLGIGPLVNALYPLYYCVSLQPSIVPGVSAVTSTVQVSKVQYYNERTEYTGMNKPICI